MLTDGLTLVMGSFVKGGPTVEGGTAFPANPIDGQKFRLTAATAAYEAGEYSWNAANSEWTNPLVEIAKNPNFTATGKKGSAISINPATLMTSAGTAFPASPVDGQKFRLTAATATYEAGEYWYEAATSSWTNMLVKLAESSNSFTPSGKKGSAFTINTKTVVASTPYDIGMQILSKPDASSVVGRFVAVRTFVLPIGLVGSVATASVVATASTVLSARKNGVQFGTITFAAGSANGVFAAAAETTFAKGDLFTLVASATVDSTFADAQITFVASLPNV